MTDIAASCRRSISEWQDGSCVPALWAPHVEYVAGLERAPGNELQQRLRGAIAAVEACDVLQTPVVPPAVLDTGGAFAVVFSCLCLEAACTSERAFQDAVRGLAALLHPQGRLVLQGAMGCDHYMAGDQRLPSLVLDKGVVVRALAAAGLDVCKWREAVPFQYFVVAKPSSGSAH